MLGMMRFPAMTSGYTSVYYGGEEAVRFLSTGELIYAQIRLASHPTIRLNK